MVDKPQPVNKKVKRRTPAQIAQQRQADAEARIVKWADSYGAPTRLLDGWDPDTGKWAGTSPVGQLITLVRNGNYTSVAAKLANFPHVSQMISKGREFAADQPEERSWVPVEVRPFIDLAREVDLAEAFNEAGLVRVVALAAQRDAKFALTFLSRRYGARWREQQQLFASVGDEPDERDQAITDALTDPNVALQLANVAHAVQDRASGVG